MPVWSLTTGKSYTVERDVAHALNVLVWEAASPSQCHVPSVLPLLCPHCSLCTVMVSGSLCYPVLGSRVAVAYPQRSQISQNSTLNDFEVLREYERAITSKMQFYQDNGVQVGSRDCRESVLVAICLELYQYALHPGQGPPAPSPATSGSFMWGAAAPGLMQRSVRHCCSRWQTCARSVRGKHSSPAVGCSASGSQLVSARDTPGCTHTPHTYASLHTHTYMHSCTHVHTQMCIPPLHTHVHTLTRTHTHTNTDTHGHTHACTRTHTHTHGHRHTQLCTLELYLVIYLDSLQRVLLCVHTCVCVCCHAAHAHC